MPHSLIRPFLQIVLPQVLQTSNQTTQLTSWDGTYPYSSKLPYTLSSQIFSEQFPQIFPLIFFPHYNLFFFYSPSYKNWSNPLNHYFCTKIFFSSHPSKFPFYRKNENLCPRGANSRCPFFDLWHIPNIHFYPLSLMILLLADFFCKKNSRFFEIFYLWILSCSLLLRIVGLLSWRRIWILGWIGFGNFEFFGKNLLSIFFVFLSIWDEIMFLRLGIGGGGIWLGWDEGVILVLLNFLLTNFPKRFLCFFWS